MARSQYIYVVTDRRSGVVKATFTVKHEMVSWLQGSGLSYQMVRVDRYRDGAPLPENRSGFSARYSDRTVKEWLD